MSTLPYDFIVRSKQWPDVSGKVPELGIQFEFSQMDDIMLYLTV